MSENNMKQVSTAKVISEISKLITQIMTYVHNLEEALDMKDNHISHLDGIIKQKESLIREIMVSEEKKGDNGIQGS